MSDIFVRHNVHVLGEGTETLIFGHGLGTDQRIWRLVAPRLAADYRIVLLDWVGCGAADPRAFDSARYESMRGHAVDLCQLARESAPVGVTYIGHSAGGMIGVLAAIAEPQLFSRLVLLAASPRYVDAPPDYVGGSQPADIDAVLRLMDENFLGWSSTFAAMAAQDAVVERELDEMFSQNDRGHLREFAESVLRSDFRSDLGKLRVPSLVLGTARDDMVPPVVGEYLHAHLAGSSYTCFDLAGHCPQMTHPLVVERAIRDYLSHGGC